MPTPERGDLRAFVEEVGRHFEDQGVPRMAGRILGALLVADPPEQSAEQLAATLAASRGSISTMTRLLERTGLIDRVHRAGDRRTYYRTSRDAWYERMRASVGPIRALRELADEGLRLLADAPPEVQRGLADMRRFYAYWEDEMPRILDGWRRAREVAAPRGGADAARRAPGSAGPGAPPLDEPTTREDAR